jgi:hypothetical protein
MMIGERYSRIPYYLLLPRLRCHSNQATDNKATTIIVTPTAPLLAPEFADTLAPSDAEGSSTLPPYG